MRIVPFVTEEFGFAFAHPAGMSAFGSVAEVFGDGGVVGGITDLEDFVFADCGEGGVH